MKKILPLLLLAACAEGEYIPPALPVPSGVPADMPSLSEKEFAVLRYQIHG